LRWLPYFPARPGANPTVSDRRSIVRLDRWQTSGSHRMFRTSCRPAVNFPTCVGVLPPARPMITSDSHLVLILQLDSGPITQLSPVVVATFSLRCLLLRLAACAACRPSATPAANFRLASAVLLHRLHRCSIRSACAVRLYLRLGLRCTPCFHRTLHRRRSRR